MWVSIAILKLINFSEMILLILVNITRASLNNKEAYYLFDDRGY